ncbi:MAG: hypothetical protein ACI30A_06745 [Paludibacteraceae bacterium]
MKTIKIQQAEQIAKLFGGFNGTTALSTAISFARYESRITRLNELLCNDARYAHKAELALDELSNELPDKLAKKFRYSKKFKQHFFINHDPRGHALKLTNISKHHCITDWGGDILLSPDAD